MAMAKDVIVPVNFVVADEFVWPELRADSDEIIPDERLSKLSGGIKNNWLLRTCYHLRQAGILATICAEPDPEAINFYSIFDYGRRECRPDVFALVPRGDGHFPMLADFIVNQNGIRVRSSNEDWIPHWPQPGILKRNPSRAGDLRTVVFKGRMFNITGALQSNSFASKLNALGFEFHIDAFDPVSGKHAWNDYQNADVVLAVRNLTQKDALKKPPSKLVNAWFAEVPALLGPEPAFQELRKSDLDYIEVRSENDILAALRHLKENPSLYEDMVENGRQRREAFSEEALTQAWIDLLNGPIHRCFEAWRCQPRAMRFFNFGKKLLLEPMSKRIDKYHIKHGKRILD